MMLPCTLLMKEKREITTWCDRSPTQSHASERALSFASASPTQHSR